jgi:hypothetical protein
MSVTSDDEIVLTDEPATRDARLYRWFLDHLAKFPGRVTAVTFAAGVAVAAGVVAVDGDESPATVVSLVATLWALFFAVMIYLLTARDTDKVLDQISDLHEQLATALAAPDEYAELPETVTGDAATGDAVTGEAERAPAATTTTRPGSPVAGPPPAASEAPFDDGSDRDRAPLAVPTDKGGSERTPTERGPGQRFPLPAGGIRERDRSDEHDRRAPRLLVGNTAVVDGVPNELLKAWASATGKGRDELSRAWTRDPRTEHQWVLETTGGERWVVFSRGARGVGVISLDSRSRGRGWRPTT